MATTAKKPRRSATQTRVRRRADAKRPEARGANLRLAPLSHSGSVLVGTASWTDPGFVADWYPPKLPAPERLAWYAEHFKLVEVNSSFYAIPSPAPVAKWCGQTPPDFVFDVKLHRLLSRHSTRANLLPRDLCPRGTNGNARVELTPKLEDAVTRRFLEAIAPIAEAGKLGALLLQLSPSFGPREHRLEELDSLLSLLEGQKLAVELRNRHWVMGEELDPTVTFFKKRRITFVTVDAPLAEHFMMMPPLDLVTTPQLAYLRAHGRNAEGYVRGRTVADRFDYDYCDEELEEIATRAGHLATLAAQTHVIFNNNKSNYAPRAAERFQRIAVGR